MKESRNKWFTKHVSGISYATPRSSPAKTGHCMISEVPSCFTEILSSLDYSTLNSPRNMARHVGIQE